MTLRSARKERRMVQWLGDEGRQAANRQTEQSERVYAVPVDQPWLCKRRAVELPVEEDTPVPYAGSGPTKFNSS